MLILRRIRLRTLATLIIAALVACSSPRPGRDTPGSAPVPGLWEQRPVVELTFAVAEDLRTVTGHETVVFTPDLPVCELVFRAWPNKPTAARTGTSLVVTDTFVDGRPVIPRVLAAGAPEDAPGTLIEIPLPECVDENKSISAELGFRLVLGENADERFGFTRSTDMAWFTSAFPLLAWQRGRGWVRDPAVSMPGETATSEDFRLASLEVIAASGYEVLGTGTAAGIEAGDEPAMVSHRFTAEAVRDVAVSVGRMNVLEQEVDGVRLHIGVAEAGAKVPAQEWAERGADVMRPLGKLLGPFPYSDLWITVVPGQTDGIESPAAIQFGDLRRRGLSRLIAHEIAHMWFYALVGNNQARNPWLDESFATFAQGVVTDERYEIFEHASGSVGRSMMSWVRSGGFAAYVENVYVQGAAVLLEARRRVGAERFDAALRSYLEANAHRIAAPEDVARAFRDLPEVVDLLQEHGALDRRDVES
jgi:hypothetical protein